MARLRSEPAAATNTVWAFATLGIAVPQLFDAFARKSEQRNVRPLIGLVCLKNLTQLPPATGLARAMGGASADTLAAEIERVADVGLVVGLAVALFAKKAMRNDMQAAAKAATQAGAAQAAAHPLEKAYQLHAKGAAPVRFDLSVNGVMVPYHADLLRMVQKRLDSITTERPIRRQLRPRAQWAAAPFNGLHFLLAQISASPATVWGVSGISLQVANAGSLLSRESLELNIVLGHAARMCSAGQALPIRVDIFEVPAAVRARFEAARTRLGASEEEWVFHGTADTAIGQIFQQGFKLGGDVGVPIANGNANGRGVYTDTLLATALGYAKGSKKAILARALPGRRGTSEHSQCDSCGDRTRSSWRIFRSGDQLLPMYLLHFA
ncbi:hypothetical protein T492DRAFT_876119 [Pavlovales sp. CCMP2436]|nr:hypothetical protein T492DRAFT_876119 [Pavlovales sp. CCMP2436]